MNKDINAYDVAIVGAGMVGLLLAVLLQKQHRRVLLIDHKATHEAVYKVGDFPVRVSALNANIIDFIDDMGLWKKLVSHAVSPLRQLMAWDHVGGGQVQFDSAEIAQANLGHVVVNAELIRVLWEQAKHSTYVTLACPEQLVGFNSDDGGVHIQTDKQSYRARLLVGADGPQSKVRELSSLEVNIRSYRQHALVGIVSSEHPHGGVALQNFMSTGPLGVLPLNEPCQSSFVWSCHEDYADALMQVSPSEFSLRISESLQHRLGVMNVISERVKFPLIERSLAQPYTDAVLLIGDAAHTIHPLAGQGANCGLQDAIWFAHCYQQWCENASRRTAGVQRLFTAYFRRRTVDYQFLRYAMRVFSEGFCESSSWVVSMRSTLMTATDQLVGIKQKMMQVMTDLGQLPKISNISSFENQPNG